MSVINSDTSRHAVVSAQNMELTFQTADGPVFALSDINLTIERGDFVSLIGPSGCGKTTLLRAIADLEQTTSGSITVNGVTPHEARTARAYGYVFQAPALYSWRTIERNVTLPLEVMGISKDKQRERSKKYQVRMMGEINKLTDGSNGKLDIAAYERTVSTLMGGGSKPAMKANGIMAKFSPGISSSMIACSQGEVVYQEGDVRTKRGNGRYINRPTFAPYYDAMKISHNNKAPTAVSR